MSGIVYFCDQGNGAWMAYVCIGTGGLTDCEWLVPGSYDPAGGGGN
jgi:hypothetical protein